MQLSAGEFANVLLAFFAIMNPIANTPIFLALTDDLDSATRRNIAIRALLLAFILISGFAIGGNLLFQAFGITLPALRIAGGILVAMVGFHLLQGETSSVSTPKSAVSGTPSESALGIAITPLALPILAGPGTIATAMSFSAGAPFRMSLEVIGAFAIVCLLTLVCFLSGEKMVAYLGRSAIKVVTRLMGLILAVIGIQMLIEGIGGAVTDYQNESKQPAASSVPSSDS
ncbi:MarC family protein [Haloferula sp.]|uniref:MarC family protein n=1 Tax=Haloferula sp. TaxID=2497595 RepID=UPI0032A070CE